MNPEVIARCPKPFHQAHRWLEVHGAAWWKALTDAVPTGEWMSIREMVRLMGVPETEQNVRYTRLVLAYVMEESGDEVVRRSGNRYML